MRLSLHFVLATTLMTIVTSSFAVLPPKYLGIKDFDKCLADKQIDTYRAWCIPARKPNDCPKSSWKQLRALSGQDRIPRCSEK